MTTPHPLTLRQGLERYYAANPDFIRDRDLYVGWIRVPWSDLQRHDIMHVVTGYSTTLDDELRLIGFLLTSLTWRRPWTYYLQSVGVLIEILWRSCWGQAVETAAMTYRPWEILMLYGSGVRQGLTVHRPIDASIDPQTLLDQSLKSLRREYGIANAGAWDDEH
jgi:hypothetical protein